MALDKLPAQIRQNFECKQWRHAAAILYNEFPDEWNDIIDVLINFKLPHSYIIAPGGNKTLLADSLDSAFIARGWDERRWETGITARGFHQELTGPATKQKKVWVEVDRTVRDSPTHSVDCYKNKVALEIEWSNKDPFYDRDLNNFRLLFDLQVISVGVIITKDDDLKPIFKSLKLYSKYGSSTTWYSKLEPRIEGGGGGGCPIMVFAMKSGLYDPNS